MRWLLGVVCVVLLAILLGYTTHSAEIKSSFQFGTIFEQKNATSDSLYFVGDVLLARDVESLIKKAGSDYPYRGLKTLFADRRYVIGNFEAPTPRLHQPTPNLNTQFSVDTAYLPALQKAGFTHFSLANNHTLDKGKKNLQYTRESLTQNKLFSFGDPATIAPATLIELDGKTVAVLALNLVTDTYTSEILTAKIASVESRSDIQIAYIHWGNEYQRVHSPAQAAVARTLIDGGVDMIVGHHPHVVQDIEIYRNKLIVYSLGNFIFDQYFSTAVQQGLVLKLSTEPTWRLTLIPVSSQATRAQPHVAGAAEYQAILDETADSSDTRLQTSIRNGVFLLNETLAISPQLE